jgi:tryptophan-rich sensory protein
MILLYFEGKFSDKAFHVLKILNVCYHPIFSSIRKYTYQVFRSLTGLLMIWNLVLVLSSQKIPKKKQSIVFI